jgi:hypothetical protein
MSPVVPDKPCIDAARDGTMMTPLRRTLRTVTFCRQAVDPKPALAAAECPPDQVEILTGHEESVRILKKGNRSPRRGIDRAHDRIFAEKQDV